MWGRRMEQLSKLLMPQYEVYYIKTIILNAIKKNYFLIAKI